MTKGTGFTLSRHVESVKASLHILDCFIDRPSLSIKELIELTDLTRNRVMRLLGTLTAGGYLLHEEESGIFTLSPKLMALGKSFELSYDLIQLARPVLRELTKLSGESASIYIRQDLELVVLLREEGSQPIRYSVKEGQRMPLHAGAPGKTLLAFGEKKITTKLIKNKMLASLTDNTFTNPEDFWKELERIRVQGYATSVGERVADAAAVAAPVFDHEKTLVCALSLAGPITRFNRAKILDSAKMVKSSAKRLSEMLGYFE